MNFIEIKDLVDESGIVYSNADNLSTITTMLYFSLPSAFRKKDFMSLEKNTNEMIKAITKELPQIVAINECRQMSAPIGKFGNEFEKTIDPIDSFKSQLGNKYNIIVIDSHPGENPFKNVALIRKDITFGDVSYYKLANLFDGLRDPRFVLRISFANTELLFWHGNVSAKSRIGGDSPKFICGHINQLISYANEIIASGKNVTIIGDTNISVFFDCNYSVNEIKSIEYYTFCFNSTLETKYNFLGKIQKKVLPGTSFAGFEGDFYSDNNIKTMADLSLLVMNISTLKFKSEFFAPIYSDSVYNNANKLDFIKNNSYSDHAGLRIEFLN